MYLAFFEIWNLISILQIILVGIQTQVKHILILGTGIILSLQEDGF